MKPVDAFWFSDAKLVLPSGIVEGALHVVGGRIAAIRSRVPRGARGLNLHGAFLAPGFIDLHVWGEAERLSRELPREGTTAFLKAIGPEPPERLVNHLVRLGRLREGSGARCLGAHLEGPFLNPLRAGALASRWLRPPASQELRQLARCGGNRLKLMTIAPELPGAFSAIRWCRRYRMVASLGHSDADAEVAQRAIQAGARAVTHVFNGMRPLHHRDPGLLGEVLTNNCLTAMVILDGVHVDPVAFQLLLRCKGPGGVALVTDSIRRQAHRHLARGGAFYTRRGRLAGSRLTMIRAVRNAVELGGLSLRDAVRMASEVPARVLGDRSYGRLEVGRRADLVAFDKHFRVHFTIVGGQIVYEKAKR